MLGLGFLPEFFGLRDNILDDLLGTAQDATQASKLGGRKPRAKTPSPEVQRSCSVVAHALGLRPHYPDVATFVPKGEHVVVRGDEADLSVDGFFIAVDIRRFQSKRRGTNCKLPRLGPCRVL